VQKAQDGLLHFSVEYSERGKTTKVDDILRELKQAGVKLEEDTLTRAFRVFEKQSEVDFFINKNARAFLEEQFDLWMYQYLFAGQNVWRAERLAQLQTLKEIACKIIAFIAQFEDELVRIWNKPKFVRNSHYVITLDKISDETLLDKLLNHPGMAAQIQEWVELGMVESGFDPNFLKEKDLTGEIRHRHYQFLPFDTRYFPDLELRILALFDDLDQALDGWLIHSENYQALSTINKKFQKQVNCIHIDPPYNTETSGFYYVNTFSHSSWLTMMENRILASSQSV
jgi:adenine specific DNA methylase Mod